MERSAARFRSFAMPWFGALAGLAVSVAAGIGLAEILMGPPQDELAKLGVYFLVAGSVTLAAAWLTLRAVDRTLSLSIQGKAFLTGLLTAAVALLNVLIIAELMFVSTGHDLQILLAVIVFGALVAVTLSLWLAREVSLRLVAIADVVESLAGGDYAARTEVIGRDEVADLAADVNDLAARLSKAEEKRKALDRERRELTAAISHDLRTPLASLRAMVEAIEDGVVTGSEAARYHQTMRREIDRMSRMIDDVFEMARIDARALNLVREPVAVDEVAADVVEAMRPQARGKAIDIQLSAGTGVVATVDGSRIERAIANLVRNALQHTPRGGNVSVEVGQTNGWVDIRVTDDGEGIHPDDLPRIWRRFFRAEQSRSRSSSDGDGAGLGLAIVRGIVEAHGGHVTAESSPGRGSTFSLRLPRE